jgi:hypothetical protein
MECGFYSGISLLGRCAFVRRVAYGCWPDGLLLEHGIGLHTRWAFDIKVSQDYLLAGLSLQQWYKATCPMGYHWKGSIIHIPDRLSLVHQRRANYLIGCCFNAGIGLRYRWSVVRTMAYGYLADGL